MITLRLTEQQADRLERVLQSTETHHRTAADRANRLGDYGSERGAKARAHGTGELLHLLKMARLGHVPSNARNTPHQRPRATPIKDHV
jgi:hypothetical protein